MGVELGVASESLPTQGRASGSFLCGTPTKISQGSSDWPFGEAGFSSATRLLPGHFQGSGIQVLTLTTPLSCVHLNLFHLDAFFILIEIQWVFFLNSKF